MNDLKELLKKSIKENPNMKTNEEIRLEQEQIAMEAAMASYVDM